MHPLKFAEEKVFLVLNTVGEMLQSPFPYKYSNLALQDIEAKFRDIYRMFPDVTIEDSQEDQENLILLVHRTLNELLPIIGFISRSTSNRNAFEAYPSLLRISKKLLGKKSNLVLSSEWHFSPHIYPDFEDLSRYVFIGLPSYESDNPLVFPISGHEFGHALWRDQDLANEFDPYIKNSVDKLIDKIGDQPSDDMLSIPDRQRYYNLAVRQFEETFCDLIGLWLFSEAFLYAFIYLSNPYAPRIFAYPSTRTRLENIRKASTSNHFLVTFPDDAIEMYPVRQEKQHPVDPICVQGINLLVKRVVDLLGEKDIERRNIEFVQDHVGNLKKAIPISDAKSLSDILNAAWIIWQDDTLWKKWPHIHERKSDVFRDIILKSIEIFEVTYDK